MGTTCAHATLLMHMFSGAPLTALPVFPCCVHPAQGPGLWAAKRLDAEPEPFEAELDEDELLDLDLEVG